MGTLLLGLIALALAVALLVGGGRLGRIALVSLLTVLGIVALAALFWVLNIFSAQQLIEGYIDELASAFGLSPFLAKAVTALFVMPAVTAAGWTFSRDRSRRVLGRAGIGALVFLYFGGLWLATREQKVTRSGEPLQCYVLTESGILWRDKRYVGTDPETGRPCELVEARLIATLDRLDGLLRTGKPLAPIDPGGHFFSTIGEPIVWFQRMASGEFEFFDAPGFHPGNGKRLEAVSEAVVEDWHRQQAESAEAARRADEVALLAAADAARLESERLVSATRTEAARLEAIDAERVRQANLAREADAAAETERRRQAELAYEAEKAAKQAEAEQREIDRLAYMRSLTIAGSVTDPVTTMGLVIVPGRSDDDLDRLASDQFPELLVTAASASRSVLPTMLAPAFVDDGFFARSFAGDPIPLNESAAFERARYILLGQLTTGCGAASTHGIMSCRVTLSFKVFGNDGRIVDSGQLTESGPGFTQEKAVERGVELMAERSGSRLFKAMGG